MFASDSSNHEQYRAYRAGLATAGDTEAVIDVLFHHLPATSAVAAGLLETADAPAAGARRATTRLLARRGPEPFWSDYVDLCGTGGDLVSRILRLSPDTLTLGDIQRHPRLTKRVGALETVLARHRLADFFAVPAIDVRRPATMAFIAGCNLVLRRSRRHLLSRMGIDALARLAEIRTPASPDEVPHADRSDGCGARRLTRRQLEIAHWLVAGKTDWEIGAILQISSKTVNYHVEKMKRQYGVRTRHQFVAAIVHQGGIAPGTAPREAAAGATGQPGHGGLHAERPRLVPRTTARAPRAIAGPKPHSASRRREPARDVH